MAAIGRTWAGRVFGTNTGNLSVEFKAAAEEDQLEGTLRFLDEQFGICVYELKGEFDGRTLSFRGVPVQSAEGVEVTPIQAKGELNPEGYIRGTWSSESGTGGNFIIHPHDSASQPKHANRDLPEAAQTEANGVSR
jgi:hypothetical protein